MIVLDASVVLDLLLNPAGSARLRARVLAPDETLHAPHLLDVEVMQVIRRFTLARSIDEDRAVEAIEDFVDMPIERYAHEVLLPRMWELRDNLTAYDASYVALAELLDAPLLTSDSRLAKASGKRAMVELITP